MITNTKGFTGHAMGAGIEDVVAIKALETGIVPPVPNYKEPDPDLGTLNLSLGGAYPVHYALRLAAGFGSQIAMSLLRWTPMPDGRAVHPRARLLLPDRRPGCVGPLAGRGCRSHRRRARGGSPPAARGSPVHRAAPHGRCSPRRACPRPVRPQADARPAAGSRRCAGPVAATRSRPLPRRPPAPAPAVDPMAPMSWASSRQMTGYPPELLDVDLDLEADLGVDTVKQAEVFAAVRERFDIERDDNVPCATSPP